MTNMDCTAHCQNMCGDIPATILTIIGVFIGLMIAAVFFGEKK